VLSTGNDGSDRCGTSPGRRKSDDGNGYVHQEEENVAPVRDRFVVWCRRNQPVLTYQILFYYYRVCSSNESGVLSVINVSHLFLET